MKFEWDKLAKMPDKNIDYSDIPSVGKDFFKNGKLRLPKAKPLISIRLDEDVLNWFKAQGPGYQTRINAVLRMYKEAQTT
jgi:uncharacterized protein (DUF4415 family)